MTAPLLDKSRIKQAFERAASRFDAADFLHAEIRNRLLDSLEPIAIEADTLLDLGAGTGGAASGLKTRFPSATLVAADFSPAMLAAGNREQATGVAADAECLAFADQQFDVVFSNLMWHWCGDPLAVAREVRRVLRFPGLFSFSTFGPGTLAELRTAFSAADRFTHVSPFIDMHDLGDLLVNSGFVEPVIEREDVTITYSEAAGLIGDLRAVGAINATQDRNRGLTGKASWQRMADALGAGAGPDGRFSVTFEIVYGQAWAGDADNGGLRLSDGRTRIPVEVVPNR